MKSIVLLILGVLLSSTLLVAQDDCLYFFPKNKGAMMVSKSYDVNDNLLYTMTYRVMKSYDNLASGEEVQIVFALANLDNKVIDEGTIEANCNDGNFYLKMVNRTISPEVIDILSTDTELVGDFLDYPNTLNPAVPFEGAFEMDGGEFTVKSKSDKKEFVRVSIYSRKYEKDEKLTTPAGTFESAKISFMFDVVRDGGRATYKGVEWFALGAGIIRSETYDENDNLKSYTVLTTLTDK